MSGRFFASVFSLYGFRGLAWDWFSCVPLELVGSLSAEPASTVLGLQASQQLEKKPDPQNEP